MLMDADSDMRIDNDDEVEIAKALAKHWCGGNRRMIVYKYISSLRCRFGKGNAFGDCGDRGVASGGCTSGGIHHRIRGRRE